MYNNDIKNLWRNKSWAIPDLLGSKNDYTKIIVGLIKQLELSSISIINDRPKLKGVNDVRTWREYAPFLKGIGIVENNNGSLHLSKIGEELSSNLTFYNIATLMQQRFRIFGELLFFINEKESTVQEINEKVCSAYGTDWKNYSNIRKRMNWLEVLGLIEMIGNRKWILTKVGKQALKEWTLFTPDILKSFDNAEKEYTITDSPIEISNMITELTNNNQLHKNRCTYNLWAPSPNKIDNIRKIINYSCEKVDRTNLYNYICTKFNLKTSSAESMMPFLKASGLLEETGRNIYVASSVAKEWCQTGADIDFIRILHCHFRFVGEMILFAEKDITRNEIYNEAKKYGLNNEKARWIASFLVEAGLLEETQYLHLKASTFGIKFAKTLPITNYTIYQESNNNIENVHKKNMNIDNSLNEELFNNLSAAATNPSAEGKASGVAFEEEITKIFRYMGFEAKRIGGSGNTDVVVKWKNDDGEVITGIIDAKSKSNGQVSHGDVSDVAIETHKEKNNADYVAIIGSN